jgi:HSP20 family protein
MAIVRWKDPFAEMTKVHETMNRLFEETFSPVLAREGRGSGSWEPAVDIYETDDEIILKAEVPGIGKDQVSIEVKEGVLTLSGERKFEKEVKEEQYHRVERSYGAFHRTFTLPSSVDADQVNASLGDGVLKIRLPKREEAKARQIAVH